MMAIVVLVFLAFIKIGSVTKRFTLWNTQGFQKAKMTSMAFLIGTSVIPFAAISSVSAQEVEGLDIATGDMEVKAIEELTAVYGAEGDLISTSLTGRIIVVNREDHSLENVDIALRNITLTDLPETIHIASLPPGESVVASYDVEGEPRIRIKESWAPVTYEDYLGGLLAEGTLNQELGEFYRSVPGIVYGIDNVLEFNITLENRWNETIQNITVSDLLPDSLDFISISWGDASYNPTTDELKIQELSPQGNFTAVLRASLKKELVGDPGTDYIDLSKETTAEYTILVEETAEWVPFARALEKAGEALLNGSEFLADLSEEFNYTSELAMNHSFDFGAALENGTVAEAIQASEEFIDTSESTAEDFAVQAGRIQKMAEDWNNYTATVKEATTVPQGSLDEVLDYIQENGLPEETVELMEEYGLTEGEVIATIQELNSGNGIGLPDITQDLEEYQNISLEIADYFFEAAYTSLEDQVGTNIYELGQESRSATTAEYDGLSAIKAQLVQASQERDWESMRSLASEEAEYAKDLALATNNFTFVGFYGIAYKAKLIAEIALNGDIERAEELLAAHMVFIADDPGIVYFEGNDNSRHYSWYQVREDGTVVIRVVAPCCGFSKSVTIEGKKYDLLVNHQQLPFYCNKYGRERRYWFGRRDIWIGEDGTGIFYEKFWRDGSCNRYIETTNIDDRVRIEDIYMDYKVVYKVWFKTAVQPPPLKVGALSGTAHDARGVPRPNIAINIVDPSDNRAVADGWTDPFGQYMIPDIPAGTYRVESSGTGYVSRPKTITITEGGSAQRNVFMARQPLATTSSAPGPSLSPTPTPAPGDGRSHLERLADRLDTHANNVQNRVNEGERWIKRYTATGRSLMVGGKIIKDPISTSLGARMYLQGKLYQGVAYAFKKGYVPAVRKSAGGIRSISDELKRRGWGF